MVVRIVTYAAESREAARQWVREHADEFRGAPGVERVTFIHSKQPPRVGADDSRPVREEVYRVMDV